VRADPQALGCAEKKLSERLKGEKGKMKLAPKGRDGMSAELLPIIASEKSVGVCPANHLLNRTTMAGVFRCGC
jgi:hypothetical protein